MGLKGFLRSNIKPVARLPELPSVAAIGKSAEANEVQYDIEHLDVPPGLTNFKLRRVVAMTEQLLANVPIRVITPGDRDLYAIAVNLVAQISQQRQGAQVGK